MANRDLAITRAVPKISPQGGAIPAGCGDDELINVRKVADGTITVAETLNNFQIADGAIFIGNCSMFAILLSNYTDGSLTELYVIPRFSITKGGTKFEQRMHELDIATGDVALEDLFRLEFPVEFTTGGVIVPMLNPCANWLFIYTASAGVVTGSSVIIDVVRGWGRTGLPTVMDS